MAFLELLPTVSTPHAAFFTFDVGDDQTYSLVRSGAGVGSVNISALPEGPLKALLTRTADWTATSFKNKVLVKLSDAPNGTAPMVPLTGTPTVTQSVGLTVTYAASAIQFSSAATAGESTSLTCTLEVRLIHSMCR